MLHHVERKYEWQMDFARRMLTQGETEDIALCLRTNGYYNEALISLIWILFEIFIKILMSLNLEYSILI